jgi:general secretion pathway protein G
VSKEKTMRAQGPRNDACQRRRHGFTLIEIMAVVVIIGLLISIVGVAVSGQMDRARMSTTRGQIDSLEQALGLYRLDNGRFPTTDQGLEALVGAPTSGPPARNYNPAGYLDKKRVPTDAWGMPFQYEQPGSFNPEAFDLWSLGADSAPGGDGTNADIGNWAEDAGQG